MCISSAPVPAVIQTPRAETEAWATVGFFVYNGVSSDEPSKHALSPGRCERAGGLHQKWTTGQRHWEITSGVQLWPLLLTRSPCTLSVTTVLPSSNWAHATRISCYHLKFLSLRLHSTSFFYEEPSLPCHLFYSIHGDIVVKLHTTESFGLIPLILWSSRPFKLALEMSFAWVLSL